MLNQKFRGQAGQKRKKNAEYQVMEKVAGSEDDLERAEGRYFLRGPHDHEGRGRSQAHPPLHPVEQNISQF